MSALHVDVRPAALDAAEWRWAWAVTRVPGSWRRIDVVAEGYAPTEEAAKQRALTARRMVATA